MSMLLMSYSLAIVLAVVFPDLSGHLFSWAMVFVIGPLLIVLPLAYLSFANGSRVTLASGLAHSVGALLLNFGMSVSIYAYGAGRTIFDPMTYFILKLELLSRALVLALVFAFAWLVSVAFRNIRSHAR
jgi:hypothetical protein